MLLIIRTFFKPLSALLPSVAAKLGFRLFCTTFEPRKKSTQHIAILDAAKVQFQSATQHSIPYSAGSVAAFEFHPLDPSTHNGTVWLVHGWQSHAYFMAKFVEPLQRHGYRVIAIDLPGHGRSSGRTFHLPLAVNAMQAAVASLGKFDSIVSHSLGCSVVASTLAGTISDFPDLSASKLVFISSPNSMRKIFDDFASMVGLGKRSTAHLHHKVVQMTGKTTDDFEVARQLQQVSADLLLIHSPDDKEVSFDEAKAISQANSHAVLHEMPGLGHRRIIASSEVVDRAVEFIVS